MLGGGGYDNSIFLQVNSVSLDPFQDYVHAFGYNCIYYYIHVHRYIQL